MKFRYLYTIINNTQAYSHGHIRNSNIKNFEYCWSFIKINLCRRSNNMDVNLTEFLELGKEMQIIDRTYLLVNNTLVSTLRVLYYIAYFLVGGGSSSLD